MSVLKIEPIKLPGNHPFAQLPPDAPMQLHGTFDARHKGRHFSVFLTRDDLNPGRSLPDWRWHLSIAGRDMKVPVWDTVAAIAHELRPGVPFALGIPPKSWWIDVHSGCLHAWELHDDNLLAQWRSERLGHTPS